MKSWRHIIAAFPALAGIALVAAGVSFWIGWPAGLVAAGILLYVDQYLPSR